MKKSFDPREELRVLKNLCGGFKLAYKLMTEELYDNSKLLACITRPLWTGTPIRSQIANPHRMH